MTSSEQANSVDEEQIPAILWLDDEVEMSTTYQRILEATGETGVRLVSIGSLAKAKKEAASGRYAASIIDLRLSESDNSEDATEFIRMLDDQHRSMPAYILSAYLTEAIYAEALGSLNILDVRNKLEFAQENLILTRFFAEVKRAAIEYDSVKHLRPEEITYREYAAAPDAFQESVEAHWKKHGRWIEAYIRRNNLAWCVVLGGEIAQESRVLDDFPDDAALEALGISYNLIPFAYTAPRWPELIPGVAAWGGPTSAGDFFPKVPVEIAGSSYFDDFDTGAPVTHVSEEVLKRTFLNQWQTSESYHQGQGYTYATRVCTVYVTCDRGVRYEKKIPLMIVRNWADTFFAIDKDGRRLLIGRDCFQALPLEIVLDFQGSITTVRTKNGLALRA